MKSPICVRTWKAIKKEWVNEPQKYYAKWKEPNTKDYVFMILLYKISLKCTSLGKENLPWARMGMRTDMQIGKSELLGITEIFQNVFWWWVNNCIYLPKISELYS